MVCVQQSYCALLDKCKLRHGDEFVAGSKLQYGQIGMVGCHQVEWYEYEYEYVGVYLSLYIASKLLRFGDFYFSFILNIMSLMKIFPQPPAIQGYKHTNLISLVTTAHVTIVYDDNIVMTQLFRPRKMIIFSIRCVGHTKDKLYYQVLSTSFTSNNCILWMQERRIIISMG